jgi:ERCC4-related helicase
LPEPGEERIPGLDTDDDDANATAESTNMKDPALEWYLRKIRESIPRDEYGSAQMHPKLAATMNKALALWRDGEKVLIFCFYRQTGRALQTAITRAIQKDIIRLGRKKTGMDENQTIDLLRRLSQRFDSNVAPVRLEMDEQTAKILDQFPELAEHRHDLVNIVRRVVRTPSFLVRFMPVLHEDLSRDDVARAFRKATATKLTLVKMLEDFFRFLVERCEKDNRKDYVGALKSFQMGGSMYAPDVEESIYDPTEETSARAAQIPNVRLANGETKRHARQTLMYTFNTPFFPEILIASSIMAEGVDLHLYCSHVIHHDLCWNPSTLEQRTGRLDRIGGKVERTEFPIEIYLPFIGETQDEKVYRVVMDRERWFKVVMGEEFKTDGYSTDKVAERLPLPDAMVRDLVFDLSIWKPGVTAKKAG